MNIAITGGGTGGHLKIAQTIKNELNNRAARPIYIGSTNGQDREWFLEDEGFSKRFFLPTSGVVNKKGLQKLSSLGAIIAKAKECVAIYKQHKIDAVFSVGGYSAAPGAIGALLAGIPLFIHEQNSVFGLLNRVLKPFAKATFCSYIPSSPVQDYPVDNIFFENARIRTKIHTVIFLGGSQGARAVNAYAFKVAKTLDDSGVKIIHQCGKHGIEEAERFYRSNGIEADYFAFTKSLPQKIAEADFAISRAGASTLWELCASAIPTLFIPYPYAYKDHQYKNAKFLFERDLCFLKREDELKEEDLLTLLDTDMYFLSRDLRDFIQPSSGAKIVDFMLS